jgi:hypothetical protein
LGSPRYCGESDERRQLVLKRIFATTVVASALSIGGAAVTAGSASAQPVVTGGLVNITVTDVASHNNVQVAVPVQVAANVCGVNVNVLTQQNQAIDCTNRTTQDVAQALAAA